MLEKAKAWQKTKAENKFAQITWPEEWGGRGGTAMQSVIWGQEESKFDAPTGPFAIGLGMCVPTVIAFGSDEHKEALRPEGPDGRGNLVPALLRTVRRL
jgi:alkylation response protein AidB-like acyl-CoA dehydrogenase